MSRAGGRPGEPGIGHRVARLAGAWAAVLGLAACAALPEPAQREAAARALAQQGGLAWLALPGAWPLVAAAPQATPSASAAGRRLTVYIEGDGLAWRTREWPSRDPTPLDPLALRLALRHAGGPAAWLARPCQYVDAERSGCPARLWTDARFGEEALAALSAALDALKARQGADSLALVGYSGGGAMAALLAARRDDVQALITVAGNLDLSHWTAHHGLPPLPGSLDPADAAAALRRMPQIHFTGLDDRVVPPQTVRAYARRLGASTALRVVEVPGQDHACCWDAAWPALQRAHPWP